MYSVQKFTKNSLRKRMQEVNEEELIGLYSQIESNEEHDSSTCFITLKPKALKNVKFKFSTEEILNSWEKAVLKNE